MQSRYKILAVLGVLILSIPLAVLAQPATPTMPPPPSFAPFPTSTPVLFPSPSWTPTPLPADHVDNADRVLEFGQEIQDVIENSVPSHRYRFVARQGRTLLVRLTPDTYNYGINLFIESAAGYPIYPHTQVNNLYIFNLPVAGNSWLVVNSYAGSDMLWRTGYTLVVTVPPEQPIRYGETITDTLQADVPASLYTFTGEAGDLIFIGVESLGLNPYINLLGEDVSGNRVQLYSSQYQYMFPRTDFATIDYFQLPTTGEYVMEVITQYIGIEGEIEVTLDQITPVKIEYSEPAAGEITAEDRVEYFSFEGNYGDMIDIYVRGDDGLDTVASLYYAVPGTLIYDDDSGAGHDPEILRFFLFEDSTYVVQVQPFTAGSTGTFEITVSPSEGYWLDDSEQTVTLDKQGSYSLGFMANAGELIRLNVRAQYGLVPFVTVMQRNVQLLNVSSGDLEELSVEFAVPEAGAVFLRLDRNYSGPVPGGSIAAVSIERLGDED